MDVDNITLIPADQNVKATAEGITNATAILEDTNPKTPHSKLRDSNHCASFGTFGSDESSKHSTVILEGVVNNGCSHEGDITLQTKGPGVTTMPRSGSIGEDVGLPRERSSSRRSTFDWSQASAGNVNLGNIQDGGPRERRTSSNIKYGILKEDYGSVDSLPSTESTKPPLLKKYKVRWYIIFVFSAANFWIGLAFSTWGPIANSLEFVFGFTDAHVAALSSLGLAGFIPMFPIYNWLLQKHGLRAPMLVGAAGMALGGIFRCGTYINIDFWWFLFVGQAVTSLSVAIQGTLGASLVAQWFPTEERVLATALITLTAPLGQAASSVIGPQVVRDHFKDVVTPENCTDGLLKKYRSNFECIQLGVNLPSVEVHNRHDLYMDINIFLFSQMGLAILIFILTLVYFPPRPRLPPTMSAAAVRLDARIGIRQMIRNRDFWCFCIVASLPYGCLTGWIPLLEPNLRPLGYSQKEAGLISFFSLTVGAVMGICSGFILSRLRRYTKPILILLLILAAGMVTWFTLQCWGTAPHSTATLYISTISIVSSLYVLTTAAVDVLCEVSYPVPENFLMTASQLIIVVIAIMFLIATFIPGFVIGITNWVLLGAVGVAIALASFGRARLLRLELDSQQIDGSDKLATA